LIWLKPPGCAVTRSPLWPLADKKKKGRAIKTLPDLAEIAFINSFGKLQHYSQLQQAQKQISLIILLIYSATSFYLWLYPAGKR
jgi:hypothetical protein